MKDTSTPVTSVLNKVFHDGQVLISVLMLAAFIVVMVALVPLATSALQSVTPASSVRGVTSSLAQERAEEHRWLAERSEMLQSARQKGLRQEELKEQWLARR